VYQLRIPLFEHFMTHKQPIPQQRSQAAEAAKESAMLGNVLHRLFAFSHPPVQPGVKHDCTCRTSQKIAPDRRQAGSNLATGNPNSFS
jgi:hypothetical protein